MNTINPLSDIPDNSAAISVRAKDFSGGLMEKIWEIARRGHQDEEYAAMCVKWFLLYVENKNATQSAKLAGFQNTQLSLKGFQLKKRFRDLLIELTVVSHVGLEPLAMQRLGDVLEDGYMVPLVGKDADGNPVVVRDAKGEVVRVPDAKIQANVIKAADSVLDRGVRPKGLALHGTLQVGDGDNPSGWQQHLDELVVRLGVDIVRGLDTVRVRPDLQAYLARQYPVKVVNEEPQAAMEAADDPKQAESELYALRLES